MSRASGGDPTRPDAAPSPAALCNPRLTPSPHVPLSSMFPIANRHTLIPVRTIVNHLHPFSFILPVPGHSLPATFWRASHIVPGQTIYHLVSATLLRSRSAASSLVSGPSGLDTLLVKQDCSVY